MTAHSIDTEALGRRAGHVLFTQGPDQPAATARETCVLLDDLAATERERDWNLESSRIAKGAHLKAKARIARVQALIDQADQDGEPYLTATSVQQALDHQGES